MTKRLVSVLFAVLIIISLAVIPASAEGAYITRLDDNAGLLLPAEEDSLGATINQVSEKCKCNVVFVTENDLNGADFYSNGTTADYADVYYEQVCGKNTDGVLVLLTLKNASGKREMYISTSGKCIKRLSDSEREDLFDDVLDKANPDNVGYLKYFEAIAKGLMEAIPPHVSFLSTLIAFAIGLVVALLIMSVMRGKLKTVKMQRGATNYVRPGSMRLSASRDTFLYRTISRTAIPKNTGSGSHTSSGGGSHGGGGRTF